MRILIIEKEGYISDSLSAIVSAHRYIVDTLMNDSLESFLAVDLDYDLVVLNCVDLCAKLREQGFKAPILMLATAASNEDIVAGLDAGADDYVMLSCAPSQLLARIRALLRRGKTTSFSSSLNWGQLRLNPAFAQVTYFHKEVPLRPKEYNLLELFLRHPKRVFSRSAIINHLWSIGETPVEGSVTNLIKDLRQRLRSGGLKDDIIETVYGLGYRLKEVPSNELNAREFSLQSRVS